MPTVIQLSLWDYLDTASKTPVDADLFGLLDRVEESIEFLPTSEKLAVAGEAIFRLGEIYGSRCAVTLAEIGYLSHPEREPCLPLDAFDCYIRQSSFVDLEQFIEAPALPEVERGYGYCWRIQKAIDRFWRLQKAGDSGRALPMCHFFKMRTASLSQRNLFEPSINPL